MPSILLPKPLAAAFSILLAAGVSSGCGRSGVSTDTAGDASGNAATFREGGSGSRLDATTDSSSWGDRDAEAGTGEDADLRGDSEAGGEAGAEGGDAGCTPPTCQAAGLTCGAWPDGCGGQLRCGTCPPDGGVLPCPNICQPLTCIQQGVRCGPAADGCGNLIAGGCGLCGVDAGPCVPITCLDYGANCGPVRDGCGGLIECGSCTPPEYCGGGGPNRCGGAPSTRCLELGSNCGKHRDACGNIVDCGTCPAPEYCGIGLGRTTCGSVPLDGGAGCIPLTCKSLGYDCGTADDGCGGTLNCGSCAPPSTCSGAGAYNQCGTFRSDGGACLNCAQSSAPSGCGQGGDGCGHLISCGIGDYCSLSPPQTCGGGGVLFQCGSGGICKPLTCAQLNYNCGSYGDGCGGVLNCGTCASPDFCGAGGFNRCWADSGAGGDSGLDVGADQWLVLIQNCGVRARPRVTGDPSARAARRGLFEAARAALPKQGGRELRTGCAAMRRQQDRDA